MSLIEKQLRAFRERNELTSTPIFGKGMIYSGLKGRGEMTKQEILESVEFTGFVNGQQGDPRKYETQAKGALRTQDKREMVVEMLEGMAEAAGVQTDRQKYNNQYDLGASYFGQI